jgi:hypothetical protein
MFMPQLEGAEMVRKATFLALPLVSFLLVLNHAAGADSASLSEHSAAMPPRVCEIRLRAWCIVQENSIITDTPRWADTDAEHTWRIHHRDQPDSSLVILEPRGCRAAVADTVEAVRFSHAVAWEGRNWDEMQVRLRKDGTCDLILRVPVFNGDPLEWPFNTGRVLLVACKDDRCSLNEPTIADVTEKYRPLRERGEKSAK